MSGQKDKCNITQELKNKNMLLKLKKALPVILFAVISVLIGGVLFEKCSS